MTVISAGQLSAAVSGVTLAKFPFQQFLLSNLNIEIVASQEFPEYGTTIQVFFVFLY
jgi:hypothetical protein